MSEKTTQVRVSGRVDYGLLLYDHQDPAEAIEQCRRMHERDAEKAAQALAAMDRGEVEVIHQRGVHVIRDQRHVWPNGGDDV